MTQITLEERLKPGHRSTSEACESPASEYDIDELAQLRKEMMIDERMRIRQVLPDVKFGRWPAGKLNSITDVPNVLVSTQSIQPDQDVNTGVTTILPRKNWHEFSHFAGTFSFNGCGELTGSHWINETGLLTSPIVLTGTGGVGDAFRGIHHYVAHHLGDEETELFIFPCVAETYDGLLSHLARFPVQPEHVIKGIQSASSHRVPEGCTGGGTGMMCHGFKAGTGSSSRTIKGKDAQGKETDYTVGVLVQANYGTMVNFHIAGVPVGRIIKDEKDASGATQAQPLEVREPRKDGSIIIIIATDLPLLPIQLQRLAKRASVGLGKVGGYGGNTSGDIFLAFSTGNAIPVQQFPEPSKSAYVPEAYGVEMADNGTIDAVFEAVADATEESIYNAICMAETVTGYKGRTVEALDLDKVREIFEKRPKEW